MWSEDAECVDEIDGLVALEENDGRGAFADDAEERDPK